MTPLEALALARGEGIELEVIDGKLKLRGATAPPVTLQVSLREHKEAIVAMLKVGPDGYSGEAWASLLHEFTATAESDGLPPDEAARVAFDSLLEWWAHRNRPQYAAARLEDAVRALAGFGIHRPVAVVPVASLPVVVRFRGAA